MAATGWARQQPMILVVDDDHDIREVIAESLMQDGFLVSTAPNGKVALEQAQATRPDLIVLDLMMPVMSGEEFLAARREDPELATTPVVVVTAAFDSQVEGAAVLLQKPFELETLLAIVARLSRDGRTLGWPESSQDLPAC
ncbi:MAG TPA: response regulator [Anaeromyxobacteraceae bacterium]|nr:response regulator [Anaeromyxobacteraceae bacterium]